MSLFCIYSTLLYSTLLYTTQDEATVVLYPHTRVDGVSRFIYTPPAGIYHLFPVELAVPEYPLAIVIIGECLYFTQTHICVCVA